MRQPSPMMRRLTTPEPKDEDQNANTTAALALWLTRLGVAEDGACAGDDRVDVDLDASMEEDAIRFFELPVESSAQNRRRRLLAQFSDNTHKLDAWLRRSDLTPTPPALDQGEPSDFSEQRSSTQRRPDRLRWPRQISIKGSVRKGYGIRKPRDQAPQISEERPLSREEDMMPWDSRWREQDAIPPVIPEFDPEVVEGTWCRTPSFGAEADHATSPSSEQDDFAEEVRAICGANVDPSSLEFALPREPREPREAQAKPRVTLPSQQVTPCLEESDEEDEMSNKAAMSREERLMRFCPEVVNPAFSQEVREVLQKSLVRGASKVLAEHRGHRLNWEKFRRRAENEESVMDDRSALRLALHLHERSQQHYRLGCPATPPLQGVATRPGSVARQSMDFTRMRQALPRKSAIAAANRKRKKLAQKAERPGARDFSRQKLFEPVPCSFECRNWRAPSPLQLRLEQEENVVAGSQWRGFLEELRRVHRGGPKKTTRVASAVRSSLMSSQEEIDQELVTRESLESGKVHDCPDAHAYHLVRQGRLEALERWGGLQFVRPTMLRELLFYVARKGSAKMMQWMLEDMRKRHPDALQWREQGGSASLLHAAAEADMLTMCALLEDMGADTEATDQNGKEPWEVAGPCCREAFNTFGFFRGDKSQQLGSTLRLTSTLQTISEKTMSRSTTMRRT